jgi:hypothetical protein
VAAGLARSTLSVAADGAFGGPSLGEMSPRRDVALRPSRRSLTRIGDDVSPMHPPSPPSDDAPRTARFGSQNGRAPIGQSASAYRLVVLAYIIAVSMPPIGFILGLILAIRFGKPASKQGVWVIAVSLVAGLVWAVIIAGGALNTTSSDF